MKNKKNNIKSHEEKYIHIPRKKMRGIIIITLLLTLIYSIISLLFYSNAKDAFEMFQWFSIGVSISYAFLIAVILLSLLIIGNIIFHGFELDWNDIIDGRL